MVQTDQYAGPISFETLQLFKRLDLLSPSAIQELQKIQCLDISDFNEAEVRSNIIDPIVRVLGYEKGTPFSVHLEKRVQFLKKNKFPDYKLTLWEENF